MAWSSLYDGVWTITTHISCQTMKKKKVFFLYIYYIQQKDYVKYMEHQDRIIITQTFKDSFSVNQNFKNLSVFKSCCQSLSNLHVKKNTR